MVSAPLVTTWQPVWQSLYNLYWTLAVAAGAITIGALVFFTIKYRGKLRAQSVSQGAEKTPLRVVLIVIIIMAAVLVSTGVQSFQAITVFDNPPNGWNDPNAVHVDVTGQRFSWSFNCTSGCGISGVSTKVASVLTVPANTVVILNISSIDVFHSFAIPALRIKADAIPGRYNAIWFEASAGTYRIQCYELCGNGHAFMIAKLLVT